MIQTYAQEARVIAWNARHADPEDAGANPAARIRYRAFHQTAFQRCPDGRRRFALSCIAAVTGARLGEGRVEDDGDESSRAFLYADGSGPQAVGHRVVPI